MTEAGMATATSQRCRYCGWGPHTVEQCPRVGAVEYHENGVIKRIEFVRVAPVESIVETGERARRKPGKVGDDG